MPATGRTFILTSYTTLQAREFKHSTKLIDFGSESSRHGLPRLKTLQAADSTASVQQLLPQFTEAQLQGQDYREVGRESDAQGQLHVYRFAHPALEKARFGTVLLDEAQYVRNPTSANHVIVDMLDKEFVVWITGTPLHGNLMDIMAPLEMAWTTLLRKWRREFPEDEFVGNPFADLDKTTLHTMLAPSYDPYESTEVCIDGLPVTSRPLFRSHDNDDDDDDDAERGTLLNMENAFDRGVRLWMYCPHLIDAALDAFESPIARAAFVVRPVLEEIQIRRGLSTPLDLADGSTLYLGANIPPARVQVEEVEHSFKNARQLAAFTSEFLQRLRQTGSSSEATEGNPVADTPMKGRGRVATSRGLNFGSHRVLFLATHDLHNMAVLSNCAGLAQVMSANGDSLSVAINEMVQMVTKNKFRKNEVDHPFAGLEHVRSLQKHDILGALFHLWMMARESDNIPCPVDPSMYLAWAMSTSPALTRTMALISQWVQGDGERVVVFTDTPWAQEYVQFPRPR